MGVDAARIVALLAPFLQCHPEERSDEATGAWQLATGNWPGALSSDQLAQLSTYLDLLLRWNTRMNLTAVRDPEEIVTRHFGESLFTARHLFPSGHVPVADCQLLDVGSGAGFPGLPIKIWAPALALTLIESRHRKATFLREAIRAMGLTEASVFCGRAQDYPGPRASVVTLRAVERLDEVLPTAAGLVAPGGRLALLIGAAQPARAQCPRLSSFKWADALPIPQSAARVLLIGTNLRGRESRL